IIAGTININSTHAAPSLFEIQRIINQTGGGSIYINNSRGFNLTRDTLIADITLVEFGSSNFGTLYNCEIIGNTYISPATNSTNGYHTYVRSSVFNGEVRHYLASSNNYYDSDAGTGNVYNGLVRYERTGSGTFSIGTVQNTYNGDVTLVDNNATIARALFSAPSGSSLSMSGNTINFLTLNTPQLVVNEDVRINNTLTFQSGKLTTDPLTPNAKIIFNDNASHTGASAASHAVLTVQKEGNDVFTFPVGSGVLYAPVSITAPASGSAFSVQYIPENPDDASLDTSSRAGTLQKITGFEYWEITRDAGTSTPTLTFAFNDPAPGVANYITDPASVRIARWTGSLWEDKGNSAFTGSTSGTVSSATGNSDFGFFTFGTTNRDTNPFMTQAFVYYLDSDGDGFGDVNNFITSGNPTPPAGYVTNSLDCDDTQFLYTDNDNDGYGTGSPAPCGVANNTDCNDADNSIYPTAPELCDGKDNDCNGQIDDGVGATWYLDADDDGFGDAGNALIACNQPVGYVSNSLDCDDNNNQIYPGATEVCDGVDNNCNGQVDEGIGTVWYEDSDGDGFGNADETLTACAQPTNYVSNALDCNDNDNTVYPGAPELCDGKDNDCNGTIDDGAGTITFYRDADGDGFGDANITATACSAPAGYVTNDDDCDDSDNSVYPGATELCDGKDNDCNGQVDDGIGATWYIDSDSDGYGDANTSVVSCTQPTGFVTNSLDCNDTDNTVYPGAPELCDGKDNDCNDLVDDNAGTYTITASANTGGSISPSGSVSVGCGDDQTFIMTADPGFVILDVLIDGVSNGAISSYTFNDVSTTHSIEAFFSAIGTNDYTIIATAGTGGGISPSGTSTVPQGSSITYTITADPCYAVSDVLVDGNSVGAITSYTFNNVNTNHTIEASFAYIPAPGPFTGVVNVCPFEGTTQPLTYSVPDMPGVISYNWVVPPTVTLLSGQGTNSINLTINNGFGVSANKQLRVYAVWPCGNSDLSIYYLQAQAPTTPQPITASTDNVCESIGSGNIGITYTIPKVNAATSYTWTAPAGVVSVVHPNGAGENDTVVVVTYGSAFAGGTISVQASNNCGISGVRSLPVQRNNPSTPGLISGPVNVCEYVGTSGALAMYAVISDPSITEYIWSLPLGATDVSGQGSAQISFRYPAGYTGGTISVTAVNGCGSSNPRMLRVSTLRPGAPGGVTVTATQTCPNRQFTYSLEAMPSGSTSVLWTVPSGATILSGQGTTSIVVSYPSSALAGTVTATGVNGCSSGNTRIVQVKLPECAASGDAPAYVHAPTLNKELEVSIFPNPSNGAFNFLTRTNSNEKMRLSITDIQGRKMSGINILPNQTHALGADLKPGIYFAEIIQGNQRIIRKILKQ
ncbi:MAG: T9SS type A sorting domain-containing protein, partial [Ferruginibacter sp.]|nr:T9SS type A sorting domain-containing protein [Ferruginibacter sp.]